MGVWLAILLFFVALSVMAGGLSGHPLQWSYEKGFETDYGMYSNYEIALGLAIYELTIFSQKLYALA